MSTKRELSDQLHHAEESLIQAWSASYTYQKRNGELRDALEAVANKNLTARDALEQLPASTLPNHTNLVVNAINTGLDYLSGRGTLGDHKYALSELANRVANAERVNQVKRERAAKARAAKGAA